ncbi:GDSL esterase/lipase 1-like [Neltuma alba]|uniref:GDSL esterase/lipase 1-like n=1 Tax=Neltuma alba TaxID=207710 RepID=UPI0010A3D9CA|nr:GDSL esterase/lipase 1-like [Prosopis alba]
MASSRALLILCFSAIVFLKITSGQSIANVSTICLLASNSAVFVFGDSIFDSGNNNYINTIVHLLSNYQPYGQTFFKFPTGRFSDGRIIPDFIAEFAKLPLLPPYLYPGIYDDHYIYGVNFASSGAGALAETSQGTVIDLGTQASNFIKVSQQLKNKLGEGKAKSLISRAVFIFSLVGNDYVTPVSPTNSTVVLPYPPQEMVDVVTGNITIAIQKIYKEGGRKFALMNAAPFSCFPLLRRNGSSISSCQEEEAALLARLHNHVLPQKLQKLQEQLTEIKYTVFDFYNALLQLMKYPSNYGFQEGEVACCGGGPYRGDYSCGGKRGIEEYELCENVNDYVYFDSVHPTEASAQHFANLMWAGTGNFTHPYNLKQLFEY